MSEGPKISWAGRHLGNVTSWGLYRPSGKLSLAIEFDVEVVRYWNADESSWTDQGAGYVGHGRVWILGKDGNTLADNVKRAAEVLGWDGDIRSVHGVPPEQRIQFSTKSETYKGEERFPIQWIDPVDADPTVAGPMTMSEEDLAALDAQFGAQFAALAGEVRRPGDGGGAAPAVQKTTKKAAGHDTAPPF